MIEILGWIMLTAGAWVAVLNLFRIAAGHLPRPDTAPKVAGRHRRTEAPANRSLWNRAQDGMRAALAGISVLGPVSHNSLLSHLAVPAVALLLIDLGFRMRRRLRRA